MSGARTGSLRARLAMGTALTTMALCGYGGRTAYAACSGSGGTYLCSGALTTPQALTGAPLNVSTDPPFSINTSGDAFTLTGTGGVTFTDNYGSAVTGSGYGIVATNATSGDITITSTGPVTGGSYSSGIVAVNSGGGVTIEAADVSAGRYGIGGLNQSSSGALTITSTGTVTGLSGIGVFGGGYGSAVTITTEGNVSGVWGVYGGNLGSGATLITSNGSVTGTGGRGIGASNGDRGPTDVYGNLVAPGDKYGTDLTVVATGTVIGQEHGIFADNYGAGALSITAAGDVSGYGIGSNTTRGTRYGGIYARNSGTSLTIEAATVSGDQWGVIASNEGTGGLSVTVSGDVTGGAADGIQAYNSANDTTGSMVITQAAGTTTTGAEHGIEADNAGGSLTIEALGRTVGGLDGIHAVNRATATDLTITAHEVEGGENGIYALNAGTGALSVTATGAVSSANGYGILALSYVGDLTVVAADVSGIDYGVFALHGGATGSLRVTTTGAVTASDESGIFAVTADAAGDAFVTVDAQGAVDGGEVGILVTASGVGGGVSIATSGDVTGDGNGIFGRSNGTAGSTIVTQAGTTTTGNSVGILALNYGGALALDARGATRGTNGYGIFARNGSLATDLTIKADIVEGGRTGILAHNEGTGGLSVTVSGDVTGGTGAGIDTRTGAGKSSTLTLNAGASVGAASGTAIVNDAGDSATTVKSGAGVTGAIRLGDGSDTLTFNGGDFAGVTAFDGGDDTSSADGWIDELLFTNVTGTIAGSSVENFEKVTIGDGAVLSITDNPLTMETLTIEGGGLLDMVNGAGETLSLVGDLALDGGGIAMEFLSVSDFDLLQVTGGFDFAADSFFDLFFDMDNLFDGLSLTFLTATEDISDLGGLSFMFHGLDPRYTADVDIFGSRNLNVSFSLTSGQGTSQIPEPSTAAVFLGGLAALFGIRRRRRGAAAI